MLKRHEVEILLRAGHRKTEVARLTGVSLCSVKRIAEENPVVHVDDAAERTKRQIGRPSTLHHPDPNDGRKNDRTVFPSRTPKGINRFTCVNPRRLSQRDFSSTYFVFNKSTQVYLR